jgi:hypothetical protein
MIFIPGNVPSLKNAKPNGIYHSKPVTKYLRSLNIQTYSASKGIVKGYKDPDRPDLFIEQIGNYFKGIEYPILLGMHFVRNSRRKADFQNLVHIVADLLVAHHYIKDDNMHYFFPVPFKINGRWFSINKENPGVWLRIMSPKDFLDVKMKTLQEHK